MHKIWSLVSNDITCEFHPIAQVYVGGGTVGQFLTDYLSENGRRITILGQISINGSVKLLGIPDFNITSGPMFIENLQAPHSTTFWVDSGTSNQNWPVIPGGTCHNVSVAWRGAVPARPAYTPKSPKNACTAARRVWGDSFCSRRRESISSTSTSCSPVQNTRVNRLGDDRKGPVD